MSEPLDNLLAALAEMERAASNLRRAASDFQATTAAAIVERGEAPVLAILASKNGAAHLAAVGRLLTIENGRHHLTCKRIVEALNGSARDTFAEGAEAGLVRAALTCPCLKCRTCVARDDAKRRAPAALLVPNVEAAVLAALKNESEGPSIFASNDAPVRDGTRIVLA